MPRPADPLPQKSLRERVGALRNLRPFLRQIWDTSPTLTLSSLSLRAVRALLPVITLYVGKLIIDEVVRLAQSGVQFGTQALSLDIDNSLPGPLLFPSLATKWTIGTGNHPAAAMVVRMADTVPPSPTGGVQVYQAPVVHLHFQ